MRRLLSTVALSALVLGAGAPAWAQSSYAPPLSYNGGGTFDSRGMPLSGDIANQLNGAVAARNDAADAFNANNAGANSYGSSGAPAYAPGPSTTATTTYWRSVSPDYPPSINDARPSYGPPPYPPPAYPPPAYPGSFR